jgi:NAD(P)-dependent dehydrogenase (short-subunit alcohol dehydrogenase family)
VATVDASSREAVHALVDRATSLGDVTGLIHAAGVSPSQATPATVELSPAGRTGTPDEVGTVGALLMGPDGGFITGSDFLMDGGVTAAYWYGELAPS